MAGYIGSLLLSCTPFSHKDKKEHVRLVLAVTNGGCKWFYLVLRYIITFILAFFNGKIQFQSATGSKPAPEVKRGVSVWMLEVR